MNGWLLLYKPENISSAGALNFVKKLFKDVGLKHLKIGHAGTLDPFARGLLVVAIGEATKLINYAMDSSKTYEFCVKWGENRDTIDREGEITATSDKFPSLPELEVAIKNYDGLIRQIPPEFSAIKVNGERAYNLVRKGLEVKLMPREVMIHKLILKEHSNDSTTFEVKCGKGFYVRSLARDIADNVGACGYVTTLKRTESKKFSIVDAIPLDKIKNILHNGNRIDSLQFLQENLKPMISILDDILVWNLNETEAKKVRTGAPVFIDAKFPESAEIATLNDSKLVAICIFQHGRLKPKRVFNL